MITDGQQTACLYHNLKVHYYIHNSPPLVPILRHITPIQSNPPLTPTHSISLISVLKPFQFLAVPDYHNSKSLKDPRMILKHDMSCGFWTEEHNLVQHISLAQGKRMWFMKDMKTNFIIWKLICKSIFWSLQKYWFCYLLIYPHTY